MAIRIAINGFGRIGRSVLRALYESGKNHQLEIVAINDVASPDAMAHLLQYDSTHGRFVQDVSLQANQLLVGNDAILLSHHAAITDLPWQTLDIDIALDCTGAFSSRDDGNAYLRQGAKKVLFSHPADSNLDNTIIYGVNHHSLKPEDTLVSNGSCTTNCIVPVIDVLDSAFGIAAGSITTIHSVMNDQPILDGYHCDLRRNRAASCSIVPVETKLHLGIARIFPKFSNKFDAISVRVPTTNVMAMDLTLWLERDVTVCEINNRLKYAAKNALRGIMNYSDAPLVSIDFNHDAHSAIVDGTLTRVSQARMAKIVVWSDNEWGFANRLLDTSQLMATM